MTVPCFVNQTIAITIAIARGHADGRVRWMYGLVHVSNGGAVWMVPSWRSCVFAGDGRYVFIHSVFPSDGVFIRFRSGLWRVSGFSFLFVLRLGPNAIKYYISRGRVSCLYLRIVRMLPFRVFSL